MTAAALHRHRPIHDQLVELIAQLGLSSCEVRVLAVIWRFATWNSRDAALHGGLCWPAMAKLAEKANFSTRWTREVVRRLEERQVLHREARFREASATDRGGMQTSTLYRLAPLAGTAAESEQGQAAAGTRPTLQRNRFDGGVSAAAGQQAAARPPRKLSDELHAKAEAAVARQATEREKAEILGALRERAPFRDATRASWIAPLDVAGWGARDELLLTAPDELHGDYVREVHLDRLRQWLADDLGVADVALI